jgi:hypothetical protein
MGSEMTNESLPDSRYLASSSSAAGWSTLAAEEEAAGWERKIADAAQLGGELLFPIARSLRAVPCLLFFCECCTLSPHTLAYLLGRARISVFIMLVRVRTIPRLRYLSFHWAGLTNARTHATIYY